MFVSDNASRITAKGADTVRILGILTQSVGNIYKIILTTYVSINGLGAIVLIVVLAILAPVARANLGSYSNTIANLDIFDL